MSKKRTKYDEKVKKNVSQFSYVSMRTVKEIAKDLGVSGLDNVEGMLNYV